MPVRRSARLEGRSTTGLDSVSIASLASLHHESPASAVASTAKCLNGERLANHKKILYLGGTHDQEVNVRERLADDFDIVEASTAVRALAHLEREPFSGVYVDSDHLSQAVQVGRLLQKERILEGMPDGVVLLDSENTILWGNGRLREWSGMDNVVGHNFYEVLGSPEILGPEFSPLHRALVTRLPCASTLRCQENRYFQVHAAPVLEGDQPPEHLIVTVRDVTEQTLQQQKLEAIHQAGSELADLTADEVARMTLEERIELLKSNILHHTQGLLQYDVVEVRLLDQETNKLEPLLAEGMKPEAAARRLKADPHGNGVTGFVAHCGKSYLCENTQEDPLYLEGAQGARSSLTVPLVFHDQVIGTFNVESPEPNAFTDNDLQFLELFTRDIAVALNTLEILAAEKVSTAAESVEAIHSAVALPVDDILNDAVNVMERYIGHEPEVVQRLQRILRNTRDIKQVIQKIGQSMAPVEAQPQAVRGPMRPSFRGKRILVVDADEGVRSAAHSLLERYGCVVETAHNGSEAGFMVRNLGLDQHYDVILADIRLPDMSGYDLMLKLQEMVEDVPLVLMTGFGYDPGHSIVKARRAGLKSVLYKPFRLDQLLETVELVISGNTADQPPPS